MNIEFKQSVRITCDSVPDVLDVSWNEWLSMNYCPFCGESIKKPSK